MINEEDCKRLREEWVNSIEKVMAERNLGKTCYNCGSDEGVELHHVVPLKLGGTNKLSNIVVLCHKCHMAAHYGRHINDYIGCDRETINAKIRSTRERKRLKRQQEEAAFGDYVHGRIGLKECRERISRPGKGRIDRLKSFIDYCDRHFIDCVYNGIDGRIENGEKPRMGQRIGYVVYKNGDRENIFWN